MATKMHTQTAYGEGSIYFRTSDRRWVAAVSLPVTRGETRKRKVFTGTTREAVEAKLTGYREANPAPEFLGKEANRERARAQGRHTMREWYQLVRSVGCTCEYCGRKIPGLERPSKDHRIPISRGGSDAIENIAVTCWPCNQEKGRMTADEYLAWKASRG